MQSIVPTGNLQAARPSALLLWMVRISRKQLHELIIAVFFATFEHLNRARVCVGQQLLDARAAADVVRAQCAAWKSLQGPAAALLELYMLLEIIVRHPSQDCNAVC